MIHPCGQGLLCQCRRRHKVDAGSSHGARLSTATVHPPKQHPHPPNCAVTLPQYTSPHPCHPAVASPARSPAASMGILLSSPTATSWNAAYALSAAAGSSHLSRYSVGSYFCFSSRACRQSASRHSGVVSLQALSLDRVSLYSQCAQPWRCACRPGMPPSSNCLQHHVTSIPHRITRCSGAAWL